MEALEKSLLDMQDWVEKASGIMKSFDSQFNNSPPWGLSGSDRVEWSSPPKTGNPWDTNAVPHLEVERFTRVEGKPFGFEAVAGMDGLKQELRESFIKPLRFKFLVEKMRKNSTAVISTESSVPVATTRDLAPTWEKAEETYHLSSSEGGSLSVIEKEKVNPNEMRREVTLGYESIQIAENTEQKSSVPSARDTSFTKEVLLERLYTAYEKFKISIPTGMLFYGPPGTGKTFITKKLAEELGCGFISKNMGEFGSSYLHQTTKNIRDFFAWAKKAAEHEAIILFLDEIDSLVSTRTNNVDANKAEEVSQFLQEFNALENSPNLIVIAATNRPDHLDPAILRSGRLDKKIYLGPPDAVARKALFQMYIEKAWRPHEVLDYDELATLTEWYVSSDIETICDEVARDASRDLLDLVDEAESGTLTEKDLDGHSITMDSLRATIRETPSSLKMVDMSVYASWLEKIK